MAVSGLVSQDEARDLEAIGGEVLLLFDDCLAGLSSVEVHRQYDEAYEAINLRFSLLELRLLRWKQSIDVAAHSEGCAVKNGPAILKEAEHARMLLRSISSDIKQAQCLTDGPNRSAKLVDGLQQKVRVLQELFVSLEGNQLELSGGDVEDIIQPNASGNEVEKIVPLAPDIGSVHEKRKVVVSEHRAAQQVALTRQGVRLKGTAKEHMDYLGRNISQHAPKGASPVEKDVVMREHASRQASSIKDGASQKNGMERFHLSLLRLRLSRWSQCTDTARFGDSHDDARIDESHSTAKTVRELLNSIKSVFDAADGRLVEDSSACVPAFNPGREGTTIELLSKKVYELAISRENCDFSTQGRTEGQPLTSRHDETLHLCIKSVASDLTALEELCPLASQRQSQLAMNELAKIIELSAHDQCEDVVATVREGSRTVDPDLFTAVESIAVRQDGWCRSYLSHFESELFISKTELPAMADSVVIGGGDITSLIETCDTELRQCCAVDISQDALFEDAVFWRLSRNVLSRFGKSVQIATSPHAPFPQAIGNVSALQMTKEDFESLHGTYGRQPVFRNTSETEPSESDLSLADLIRARANSGVLTSDKKLPDRRRSLNHLHLDRRIAAIYERFPQTYGAQRILAAKEAVDLLKVLMPNNESAEARIVWALLPLVDVHLHAALVRLCRQSFAPVASFSPENSDSESFQLTSAQFARWKERKALGGFFRMPKAKNTD